jgi:hypothetical protein
MKTPVGPIIDMIVSVVSEHPVASLAVFLIIFGGPLLVWMHSGNNGPGRHR